MEDKYKFIIYSKHLLECAAAFDYSLLTKMEKRIKNFCNSKVKLLKYKIKLLFQSNKQMTVEIL